MDEVRTLVYSFPKGLRKARNKRVREPCPTEEATVDMRGFQGIETKPGDKDQRLDEKMGEKNVSDLDTALRPRRFLFTYSRSRRRHSGSEDKTKTTLDMIKHYTKQALTTGSEKEIKRRRTEKDVPEQVPADAKVTGGQPLVLTPKRFKRSAVKSRQALRARLRARLRLALKQSFKVAKAT